jgi:hypothetical protein
MACVHFVHIYLHVSCTHNCMARKLSNTNFVVANDILTHSQLLEGFKCESKWKATEKGGVGARSLAHNTWGVEGRVEAPGWD